MNKSFLLFMVKRGDQKLMKKSCCHPFKKKGLVGQKKLRRREPEEGSKCRLRNIRRMNPNLMVAQTKINFKKHGSLAQFIKELIHSWNKETILDSNGI